MQLDHINIKAPEALLEEVRDFYCAVLGLQEGARPKFSSPGYWLYAGERPLVHLSRGSERPASPAPSYLDHVAFRAVGLQAFTARLDVAAEEFATHGFESASLNRIIQRSDTNKGSFYYYFDNKEDLFGTVLRDAMSRFLGSVGTLKVEQIKADSRSNEQVLDRRFLAKLAQQL